MNVRHIARIAGISPSAVSLALRDSPRISEKTKALVRKVAKEQGYSPDARIAHFMRHLRKPPEMRLQASFGVISFYDTLRPWERSPHLGRIFDGMAQRASELGYRLEPLWLRAPGMTFRRFRGILETRGIEGLLCFGSPDLEEEYPDDLGENAIVTIGLSIKTRMHRVTSHFFKDTMAALHKVHEMGYRRPGLVIGWYEEIRSGHAHSSAYLGWCEQVLGPKSSLPVLWVNDVERDELAEWIQSNEPDVILFVHLSEEIAHFGAILKELGIRVPKDLGVAVLSHFLDGTGFSGMQQNQQLMGAWAVELLASRIANHDFGIPTNPRIEMVESQWVDGKTLAEQGGQPLT